MRNFKYSTWIVVFLALCIILSACAAPSSVDPSPVSPTLTAAGPAKIFLATGEWEPYTGEQMEGQGAFTEIVMATFKEMEQPVEVLYYPWKRAESEVQAGSVFAAFPYITTEEREQTFDFSDPVLISWGRLFYMPERQPSEVVYVELEDLQPYTIGGVLGYWYESPFKEAGLKVDYVASDDLNIQKLYAGRVDLVASEELVGWMLIQKLYPQDAHRFATVQKPLNESALRLMISRLYPNSAELTQRFDAALKTITEQGIVEQILAKYGVRQ